MIAISLTLLLTQLAYADLEVAFISESSLPYEYSPANYSNSNANYSNSIANYSNSSANYNNSTANYSNSSAKNSSNGSNRLLVAKGSSYYDVGYYVKNSDGLTNFFSRKGERIFYNPVKGFGIFDSQNGTFNGVLALVGNEFKVVLTESGQKTLLMSQ